MSTKPFATKAELRSQMRRRRSALSVREHKAHGRALLQNILTTRRYQNSRVIACYMPIPGEIDTLPLIQHALSSGRQIYLPVIDSPSMWFCRWSGEPLTASRASNLQQPSKRSTRITNVREIDLAIVPLVAFTRSGSRLGQGGGYYDRTFAFHLKQNWRKPTLLGVAHHVQETEHIPVDAWDVPLCGIVTNCEVID